MNTCRGCGKEIVWAETQHGKKVPLDPKALVFSVMSENGKMIAVSLTGHRGPAGDLIMTSHFATCPNANDFHKKPESAQQSFIEPKEPGE